MVIPQLIRRYYVGYSLGIQMTLNIIIGGTVMVIADWFGGIILQTYQIPASIVLALIGIPVLFYLMVTQPKTVD
jgi:iron complex transport system permease protein